MSSLSSTIRTSLSTVAFACLLAACGGGGSSDTASTGKDSTDSSASGSTGGSSSSTGGSSTGGSSTSDGTTSGSSTSGSSTSGSSTSSGSTTGSGSGSTGDTTSSTAAHDTSWWDGVVTDGGAVVGAGLTTDSTTGTTFTRASARILHVKASVQDDSYDVLLNGTVIGHAGAKGSQTQGALILLPQAIQAGDRIEIVARGADVLEYGNGSVPATQALTVKQLRIGDLVDDVGSEGVLASGAQLTWTVPAGAAAPTPTLSATTRMQAVRLGRLLASAVGANVDTVDPSAGTTACGASGTVTDDSVVNELIASAPGLPVTDTGWLAQWTQSGTSPTDVMPSFVGTSAQFVSAWTTRYAQCVVQNVATAFAVADVTSTRDGAVRSRHDMLVAGYGATSSDWSWVQADQFDQLNLTYAATSDGEAALAMQLNGKVLSHDFSYVSAYDHENNNVWDLSSNLSLTDSQTGAVANTLGGAIFAQRAGTVALDVMHHSQITALDHATFTLDGHVCQADGTVQRTTTSEGYASHAVDISVSCDGAPAGTVSGATGVATTVVVDGVSSPM